MSLTSKTSHTHTPNHTDIDISGDSRWWGRWFSVRVYSLNLYLKRPTIREQENARDPLATKGKNSLGAQHAPRGGGVGLAHLEVNRDPQYNGALSVPMRLPRLPSHNNSRAEMSFQAFKLSENKPRIGRRHKAPVSAAKKSFWMYITLIQWSPQVKTATTCYICNQSAPAYTWQSTSKRQENHRALPRHKQYKPNLNPLLPEFGFSSIFLDIAQHKLL